MTCSKICLPLIFLVGANWMNADTIPLLFEAGKISDELGNRDMAISPDGKEMFYTIQYRSGFGYSAIMHSKKLKGKWSMPGVVAFSGKFNDLEPAFSPDGSKLYFSSSRSEQGVHQNFDIWYVTKLNGSWGNPVNMGAPINSEKDEFYPSVTASGNIYFTRTMEGKDEDIVVCKYEKGQYQNAISLPDAINTTGAEFNAFVDPSERYIIFTGYKRVGNYGSGDLFISHKLTDETWSQAINLGNKVNGTGLSYCPYVSPDKKMFYFTSSRGIIKTPFATSMTLKQLKAKANDPLNGNDNIYWMDAGFLFRR